MNMMHMKPKAASSSIKRKFDQAVRNVWYISAQVVSHRV